ncbi:MAG TPA: DNA polymerase IV [Spirochaetota bacterium]
MFGSHVGNKEPLFGRKRGLDKEYVLYACVCMRVIMHIDMDAFFASVEQIDHPEYQGKPVIVGADPKGGAGRGVVSTASYEARKYGIHSAMPISKAYERCPHGIYVHPHMRRYVEVSNCVFEIFHRFSPLVEDVGIDEAFLDCTGCRKLFGTPREIAEKVKKAIFEETGLTASVGIATNKSVAKIASDMNKPDGITECPPGQELSFLAPLPIGKLWGAGKKTVEKLESVGIRKIGDLAGIDPALAESLMGKSGLHMWYLARGIDRRPVVSEPQERKSISEENTFECDTDDAHQIASVILAMSDKVTSHLRASQMLARTVTVKIRLEGFETFTRQITLSEPFSDMATVKNESSRIFSEFDRHGRMVRLIGVGVTNLLPIEHEEEQGELFPILKKKTSKSEKLLDDLQARYGKKVSRGSLIIRDNESDSD